MTRLFAAALERKQEIVIPRPDGTKHILEVSYETADGVPTSHPPDTGLSGNATSVKVLLAVVLALATTAGFLHVFGFFRAMGWVEETSTASAMPDPDGAITVHALPAEDIAILTIDPKESEEMAGKCLAIAVYVSVSGKPRARVVNTDGIPTRITRYYVKELERVQWRPARSANGEHIADARMFTVCW